MAYAVCRVSVAPLRTLADHKSEMSSQLLLAEAGLVLEESKDFIKLQCLHDGYEGWVQRSQLSLVEQWHQQNQPKEYAMGWVNAITINEKRAAVPMGIPVLSADNAALLEQALRIDMDNIDTWDAGAAEPTEASVRHLASQFLNTPYIWGGRTVFGIDCSGFAQMVFRFFDIALLRDAWMQAGQGEVVGFLQEAKCGDLAFFDDAEEKITHVGILLNDREIIHSSGNVRIDMIDSAGIVNVDTGKRTHQLRIIKRYF